MGNRIEGVLELPARPHHVFEELHVLDRARKLSPELVGAIEQVDLAPCLDPNTFEHDRAQGTPAAAERHGDHRRRLVARSRHDFGAVAAHGDRVRRGGIVGADLDTSREVGGVRRGLQHEMARATRMNPHRRAIGGEQPVGAVAEDLEPGREVQRRGEHAGELVEQRADVALQFLGLTETEQFERGDERVRGLDGVRGDVGGRWRLVETDREQPETLVPADERQQQRRSRFEAHREIRCLVSRVGDQCRHAALERVGHDGRLDRSGQPGVGPERVEPKTRRGL